MQIAGLIATLKIDEKISIAKVESVAHTELIQIRCSKKVNGHLLKIDRMISQLDVDSCIEPETIIGSQVMSMLNQLREAK